MEPPLPDAAENHRVPVIDRMMDMLAVIERLTGGASIRQLVDALGVPRSTVYRIANTLQAHGVLRRTPDGNYMLGTRLLQLAGQVAMRSPAPDLAAIAAPYLQRLSATLGEGSKLSVRDGKQVIVIGAAQGQRGYALSTAVGQVLPMHAGAAGKLLLSALPAAERDGLLYGRLTSFTAHTITDARDLTAALARIRRQGWAHDPGEFERSVEAYAAPVRDRAGAMIAAVSVPFLTGRNATDRIKIRRAAVAAAAAISAALSAIQPPATNINNDRKLYH